MDRASPEDSGAGLRSPPAQGLPSLSPTPGLGEVFPWQSFTTLNSCQAFNARNKISVPHQEQLQSGKLTEADPRLLWGRPFLQWCGTQQKSILFPGSEQGTFMLQTGLERGAEGLRTEELGQSFSNHPCLPHSPLGKKIWEKGYLRQK